MENTLKHEIENKILKDLDFEVVESEVTMRSNAFGYLEISITVVPRIVPKAMLTEKELVLENRSKMKEFNAAAGQIAKNLNQKYHEIINALRDSYEPPRR